MIPTTDDKVDLSLVLPYTTQQAIAVHAVANDQTVDAAFEHMVGEGMRLLAARTAIPRSRNRREGRFVGRCRGTTVRSQWFRRVGRYTARLERAVRAALRLAERFKRNGYPDQAAHWAGRAVALIEQGTTKGAR